jgi:hypothetical protein
MNSDSPFVEYLIIGTHTSLWILLIVLKIFEVPLSSLLHLDAASVLLLLPFAYLLGMMVDSMVQFPLEKFRTRIRDRIFTYEDYKDEYIAFSSPELYSAYDVRVRRVRILGAAIFNWPILCIALLFHVGFTNLFQSIFVISICLAFTVFSIITWHSLYKRAYKFRRNACDVIRMASQKKLHPWKG